jgi:hypothetical protein
VILEGPIPPDSQKPGLTHSACPIHLRDTGAGWEFALRHEQVRVADPKTNPSSWPHEGDYEIILPGAREHHGTARVRIDCKTLRPLGMVNAGA